MIPDDPNPKRHGASLSVDQEIIDAARQGDAGALKTLLDEHPDKLHLTVPPYDASLLFPAAQSGSIAAVDLLLSRGLDVNHRERGDNTGAMHWAAAQGNVDMVRALADAGGDVIGEGDDHSLGVIGWATCWETAGDAAPRAVADLLISRGASHHIFSAIAVDSADDVRRIVAADSSALNQRQSRHENHRTPLQFAVARRRARMVALVLGLGADPLAADGAGMPVAAYATDGGIDLPVMHHIRDLTRYELDSAAVGRHPLNVGPIHLVAAAAVRDWDMASSIATMNRAAIDTGGTLHLLAKRGDAEAVRWLLARGANPNATWAHWDADVTPLHLAAAWGHTDVVRLLLDAGADSTIRDTKHDGDALGWAEFFNKPEVVQLLKERSRAFFSP